MIENALAPIDTPYYINLPKSVLERLLRDGIISNPLTDPQIEGLKVLSSIWGKSWYVQEMMQKIPPSRRGRLAERKTRELSNIDRYVLSLYFKPIDENEVLSIEGIIRRVKKQLKAVVSADRVRQIRQLAYDIRRGKIDGSKYLEHDELEIWKNRHR